MPRALILAAAVVMQAALPADLDDAVWDAVRPALPFPESTEQHEPVDGSSAARWIVRRARGDEDALVAEVIANPLNRETQERAAQDMAAIQREVFAAERQAQSEFERAREEARRSGSPVTMRGITLDDEGIAGDRADAEERMTIEAEIARAEHLVRIDAADAPVVQSTPPGTAWIVKVPARELRSDDRGRAHYHPALAIVYFASAKPTVTERTPRVFTIRAKPSDAEGVVVVTLRGNGDLIDDVIARADWSRVTRRHP